MQIFGGSNSNGTGYRWAEAADNVALSSAAGLGVPSVSITTPPDYEETMHRRTRSLRREPVGATSESSPLSDGHARLTSSTPSPCPVTQLVVLANEGGPLGIHVVPDYSPLGNELGLLVQGVEPGGRIHRDGRIAVQDRITEINGQPLQDVPFHCAQDLFRNALQVNILLIIELCTLLAFESEIPGLDPFCAQMHFENVRVPFWLPLLSSCRLLLPWEKRNLGICLEISYGIKS